MEKKGVVLGLFAGANDPKAVEEEGDVALGKPGWGEALATVPEEATAVKADNSRQSRLSKNRLRFCSCEFKTTYATTTALSCISHNPKPTLLHTAQHKKGIVPNEAS